MRDTAAPGSGRGQRWGRAPGEDQSCMAGIFNAFRKPLCNSTLDRGIVSSLSANFSLKPGLDLSPRFMQLPGTRTALALIPSAVSRSSSPRFRSNVRIKKNSHERSDRPD